MFRKGVLILNRLSLRGGGGVGRAGGLGGAGGGGGVKRE